MKFSHLGDCHLGSWRFPELQELNMQSFSKALDVSIKEKVDMVLISGDLFDSAYPPIEILKQTFAEFRKLNESKIPCFIIAGSHDYSVSGKTFLDVLEHAGFCKNVYQFEERNNKIIIHPTIHEKYAIYGYPGKKSGLEIPDLRKVIIQDAPGFLKIFMLHTSLKEAIGDLPIDSINIAELPKADYYALAHLHIDFCRENVVYSGPIFPNNFEELEELSYGQFYIIEHTPTHKLKTTKMPIKLKDILKINMEVNNSLNATEKIISELNNHNLENKIILLRVGGLLPNGRISDIRFDEIEKFTKSKGAYVFIKNISKLSVESYQEAVQIDIKDMHDVEEKIIEKFSDENAGRFNDKISAMVKSLSIEKQEGEVNQVFEERLISEMKKILNF